MRRWMILVLLFAVPCTPASADDSVPVEEYLREAGRYLDKPLVWNPNDKAICGRECLAKLDPLEDVPLMDRVSAIRGVLKFYELEMSVAGPAHHRVYLVYDAGHRTDMAAAREALTRIVVEEQGKRVLKILPIEHAKPREVARIIEHLMIETSLRVSADIRSNRLLLRGLQSDIDQALEVIKALDLVVFEIKEVETEKKDK